MAKHSLIFMALSKCFVLNKRFYEPRIIGVFPQLYLRKPERSDLEELSECYEKSEIFLRPWSYPPSNVRAYLEEPNRYLLCLAEHGEIVGTFNISNIIRGFFQSAYLSYEVFVPHQAQGYMRVGMRLLLKEAFDELNLHRLEANIQPSNKASIALVAKAGFVKEGLSKNYLNVGGKGWKDHERWAIINPRWRGR